MERHYSFPLQPYSIQVDFTSAMFQAINEKKVGVFESPTGTGKTLSIICASMTWLHEHGRTATAAPPQPIVLDAEEPRSDAVHTDTSKLGKTEAETSLIDFRSQSALISYEPEDEERIKRRNLASRLWSLHRPKVVYLSRTHSQLDQFTQELKKTVWGQPGQQVTVVRLASRQHLCINYHLDSVRHTPLINHRCKELLNPDNAAGFCFAFKKQDQVRAHLLGNICDVEDLVTKGQQIGGCPYYASRSAIEDADVILAPYSSVLNKRQRENIGLSLANTVVIIDEAHNLGDAVVDAHCSTLSERHIAHGCLATRAYYDRYGTGLKPRTRTFLAQVIEVLEKLNAFIGHHTSKTRKSFSVSAADFVRQNSLELVDFSRVIDFIEEVELINVVNELCTSLPERLDASSLHYFEQFIACLTGKLDEDKIIFEFDPKKETSGLRFLTLDAAKPFSQIIEESKCVMLAGGTMEPKAEFEYLCSSVPAEQVMFFQCGHVITPDRLLLTTVNTSTSGVPFRFTFDRRDDESMLTGLCELFVDVMKVVPHGIVVFLPSYNFIYKLKLHLIKRKLISTLEQRKKVFFDDQRANILEDYTKAAVTRGAILFAVVRGKLSEGINFSDRLGRCIILVGMPYPNKTEVDLREKMRYFDRIRTALTGQEYYTNLCHKAINQSIGRSIRHSEDFAAILLVDCRHESEIKQRPQWMHQHYRRFSTFPALLTGLSHFYKSKLATLRS